MAKPKTDILPTLLFPAQKSGERAWMKELKKQNRIRSVGPRLYVSVPRAQERETVRAQWSYILSRLFPGALLTHRTALEFRPNEKDEVFLTANTNRRVEYPGLKVNFLRGEGPLPDDPEVFGIKTSSLPRALLENLSANDSRVVPIEDIEKKLEEILHQKGEDALNKLRDRAREIAKKFKWKSEFEKLNAIIGALQGTQNTKVLKSVLGQSRAQGLPFDSLCFEKLERLFGELRHYPFTEIKELSGVEHLNNKAFFEAYFSNYIEGTTFDIEEAEQIVFERVVPETRPKDAHDILGTFQLVSDLNEMKKTPGTFYELIELLCRRHQTMLKGRTEALPGKFKDKPNRAGNTHFVHPDYIMGTLNKGFEFYFALPTGLPRAAFIMFLITEVHPFVDGNGRVGRIMMNAELVAYNLSRIIIPNVYREDYLSALRALSRRGRPEPFIRMLYTAQKFSTIDYTSYRKALKFLQAHNWFEDPSEAKLIL